ncbi:MAG: hypothetical protein OEX07_07265 [Gammaproteobacteria bacterium]|nr:hypothetical protein [Gammaproteobacteria bacterium]
MKTYSMHIFLAVTFFSMPLYAGEANLLTVSSLFSQMDSDKDGVIKPNEINRQSVLSTEFTRVDRNSDGVLDPNEFEIFIAKADI